MSVILYELYGVQHLVVTVFDLGGGVGYCCSETYCLQGSQ